MFRAIEMTETTKKLALWDFKARRSDRPEAIKRDTIPSTNEIINRSVVKTGDELKGFFADSQTDKTKR